MYISCTIIISAGIPDGIFEPEKKKEKHSWWYVYLLSTCTTALYTLYVEKKVKLYMY
jgi:hypothetical protein